MSFAFLFRSFVRDIIKLDFDGNEATECDMSYGMSFCRADDANIISNIV